MGNDADGQSWLLASDRLDLLRNGIQLLIQVLALNGLLDRQHVPNWTYNRIFILTIIVVGWVREWGRQGGEHPTLETIVERLTVLRDRIRIHVIGIGAPDLLLQGVELRLKRLDLPTEIGGNSGVWTGHAGYTQTEPVEYHFNFRQKAKR